MREIDPALPAYSITPLDDVVSESVAQRRFSMLLLGLFALIALFLAAVGLYGGGGVGGSPPTPRKSASAWLSAPAAAT